jgi:hypothetical protein
MRAGPDATQRSSETVALVAPSLPLERVPHPLLLQPVPFLPFAWAAGGKPNRRPAGSKNSDGIPSGISGRSVLVGSSPETCLPESIRAAERLLLLVRSSGGGSA